MNLRRLILLGALLTLALSCSRSVEPGVYTVQGGFVRVYVDSLGNTKALPETLRGAGIQAVPGE